MSEDKEAVLPYSIQTIIRHDGARCHRLLIEDRDCKWVIDDLSVQFVGSPGAQPYGFVLFFPGLEHDREQLGTVDAPLPVEILDVMQGEGLLVAYISDNGAMRFQALYVEIPGNLQRRPREAA